MVGLRFGGNRLLKGLFNEKLVTMVVVLENGVKGSF